MPASEPVDCLRANERTQLTAFRYRAFLVKHRTPACVWGCPISGIDCLISGLDCFTSGLDCLISGLDCLTSGLDCFIYGESRQLWYVWCAHTCARFCLISGPDCLISGLDCLTSGLDCHISGLDCLTSDLDCLIFGLDGLISGLDCFIYGESRQLWYVLCADACVRLGPPERPRTTL